MALEIKTTMMSPNEEMVLWTAKDLQKYCHFSRTRAYQVMRNPETPTIFIGGRVFVLRQKFVEMLEQNTHNRDHPIFDG